MTLVRDHEALIRHGTALHFSRVATEPPPPGGLLIALSLVGVCGTDLQIINGTRPDTAEILGHEGLGTVVASTGIGPLAAGDQVVFNPAAQLSRGWILGHNTRGLFQKYITLSSQAVEDGLVLRTSERMAPLCGALAEPLACVVYGHELISNAVPDLRTVVVFGGGPVGLLATIYLNSLGVKVWLVHTNRSRLDTVERLKILNRDAMLVASDDVGAQIAARSGGQPVDAALICTTRTGAPSALQQAAGLIRQGGCIDLVTNYPEEGVAPYTIDTPTLRAVRSANVCGLPKEGRYLTADFSGRQIAFTGHRGSSHAHLEKALHALRGNMASYERLITHVLPLRKAADAIQTLSQSRTHVLHGLDCIKLAIDMNGSPRHG